MCGCGGAPRPAQVTRETSGSARPGAPVVANDPGGYVWQPPETAAPAAGEPVPAKA